MKESIKEHILSSKDLLFDFVLFCCTSGSRSSWRAILSGGPRIRKKNRHIAWSLSKGKGDMN